MPTLVCVPILVGEVDEALAHARAAADLGAHLVEYRVDHLFHGEGDEQGERDVVRLVEDSPIPCIVTCRSAGEGGDYDGDDASRISLYERLATLDRPPRYIDVELATYRRSANLRQKVNLAVGHERSQRDLETGLILSAHDFKGRPANLFSILGDMRAEPAAKVHKIAWMTRSLRDNIELFEVLREKTAPTIALGMGEAGLMSRVLAPKFGGFLTFASLRDTSTTAPGQPTIADLRGVYRFDSIGASTKVYGVIGHPVGHSVSPHVHNAGFESVGHDGVYVPMPVAPGWEPFKATVLALLDVLWLDFAGASVTIPHKENLLRLAREDDSRTWIIDEMAQPVGAANTLTVNDDGSVRVSNTDVAGAIEPLREALGGTLEGARIGIIGAGGAARGAAFGLADAGAEVVIYNRTREKAEALARAVCEESANRGAKGIARCGDPEKISGEGLQAVANFTPVGMSGGPDEKGIPGTERLIEDAPESLMVMDSVYNPIETALVRRARERGLRTIDGLAMFVRQASAQFALWTGRDAPEGLFDRVARETLGRGRP